VAEEILKAAKKLIQKLLSNPMPSEMDYRDVKLILEHEGWNVKRGGKHFIAKKAGEHLLTIPVHSEKEKVRKEILKQIIDRLNLEEKYEEE